MDDREVEPRKAKYPKHESPGRLVDTHQPAKRVLLEANYEMSPVDVRSQRENGLR